MEQWEICQIVNYRFFSARFSHEETTMTIRVGMETLDVETKSNKKGKVRRFFPPRIGETRETEKDVRSREVSPYNRLGSLTYAEPPLHAISTTISLRHAPFVRPVPQRPPPPPLLFRSRCTVAFGLCIIITITASSSWLVVEKPPRILPPSLLLSASPPNFLFFPHASVLRFVLVVECQETRDEKEKEKDGLCSRVCVN